MKTNACAFIAFAAIAAFGYVAEAQTVSQQLSEQTQLHEGTVPQFKNPDHLPLKKPEMGTNYDPRSPIALEYKLGTHVEAIARKYGQLDQAVKRCRIEGSYYGEDSLADLVGDNLTTETVRIAKLSYREGQRLDTPPCDQIKKFMSKTLEQVERHREVIVETSNALSWAKIQPRQEVPNDAGTPN
jgi:hypothetical protein